MRISEGKPYPLGATADGVGANFAVFSAHATKFDVCIFDAVGGRVGRPCVAASDESTVER